MLDLKNNNELKYINEILEILNLYNIKLIEE